MEKLLKIRNEKKARKPVFMRQCANKIVKLVDGWRQPRGRHSKTRRKLASRKRHPSMGYSSPRLVRGLHRSGLKEVRVSSISDLKQIDAKTQGVVLAKLGQKKKLELIKKSLELNLTILNIPDAKKYVKEVEKRLETKKKENKAKEEKKKKSRAEAEKKAKEKSQEEKNKTEEDKEAKKKEAEREKVKLLESGE